MTDPITQVLDEIELQTRAADECWQIDSATPDTKIEWRDWASRLRAYWTPERRAFVEAAEGWGANSVRWDGAVGAAERRALRKEAVEICVRMDALYRAMIEAEKGEK